MNPCSHLSRNAHSPPLFPFLRRRAEPFGRSLAEHRLERPWLRAAPRIARGHGRWRDAKEMLLWHLCS